MTGRSFLLAFFTASSLYIPFPLLAASEGVDAQRVLLRQNAASAESAARALQSQGAAACRAALPDLIAALRYDEESVFQAVGPAIVLAGESSVGPLEKLLSDANFFVQRRAAELLGKFGSAARSATPELAQLVLDPKVEVHSAAEAALIQIGEPSVPAVAGMLQSVDEQYRRPFIQLLARLGSSGTPFILERLRRDGSPYIRTAAAEALGSIQPATPAVVSGLERALSDLDEGVRAAAADSLGDLKEPAQPAVGPLLLVAYEDKDGLVRQKAQQALSSLGKLRKDSLPSLMNALHSRSEETRRAAAGLLGQSSMTVTEASVALGTAIKDKDPGVRLRTVQSAETLSQQTGQALSLFQAALADSQLEVRAAAIQGLRNCVGEAAGAAAALTPVLQDPNPAIRRQAIQALGNLGAPALPALHSALKDSYGALADEAAAAILKIAPDSVSAEEKADLLKRSRRTKSRK